MTAGKRLERMIAAEKVTRSALAQTKLTDQESADLDALVKYFRAQGIANATRSSILRASLVETIRSWREEVEAPVSTNPVTVRDYATETLQPRGFVSSASTRVAICRNCKRAVHQLTTSGVEGPWVHSSPIDNLRWCPRDVGGVMVNQEADPDETTIYPPQRPAPIPLPEVSFRRGYCENCQEAVREKLDGSWEHTETTLHPTYCYQGPGFRPAPPPPKGPAPQRLSAHPKQSSIYPPG
ncbi:hypothetical protein SEA_PUPPER_212 [Gordonia phage Pupper]|uniref:Uncharacterized protein n=1 Tax=Gordonia phage Pupper TaxID=2571249 RepID=A0A4Y6EIY9_9CAUD|nr:hypothetical protein KHQ83_gp065 [Gordonia phage Pupper]QDF18698.1 hypothetical protein SEA_PUPPER_212 [Gordonia phage Pupper]